MDNTIFSLAKASHNQIILISIHSFIIFFNIKLTNATMCTTVKQMEQSIYTPCLNKKQAKLFLL